MVSPLDVKAKADLLDRLDARTDAGWQDCRAVVALVVSLENERTAQAARIAELERALEWYGEQSRLCRLVHSGGDAGRNALAADGGLRAARALSKEQADG